MKAQIERILHRPNPWLTLIPFWIVSGALTVIIGAVTVVIMLNAAPRYHMNVIGEPDLLMSELPPQSYDARMRERHDQN